MILKLLGSLLCIFMMIGLGLLESKRLTDRTKHIRYIVESLQMLETEMAYSEQTLQNIFASLSKRTAPPINQFYALLAKGLQDVVTDFAQLWQTALQQLAAKTALKQSELDILKQFGQQIGFHSFSQQQKHITLTIYYLQRELDEATRLQQKYSKTIITLASLFGVFIVVIVF